MTYLSPGDIGDLYRKFRFRGKTLLRGLLQPAGKKAAGHWDQTRLPASNWWNIPAVRKRWNEKITGDPNQNYPEFVREKFLKGRNELHMVSPGCGTGSHERFFSEMPEIGSIMAFDLSPASIAEARKNAPEKIRYEVKDFYSWLNEPGGCDLLFFYSSLHHFKDLDTLIPKLRNKLNPEGLLILHEYTGPDRMMWTREQLREVESLLKELPESKRRYVFGSGIKRRHYRPGLWRTLLTDPSESIASSRILPNVRKHFECLYEKGFGGNLLHLLFKDIAHHFAEETEENRKLLEKLFRAEDRFLESFPSDFHFGVYKRKED